MQLCCHEQIIKSSDRFEVRGSWIDASGTLRQPPRVVHIAQCPWQMQANAPAFVEDAARGGQHEGLDGECRAHRSMNFLK